MDLAVQQSCGCKALRNRAGPALPLRSGTYVCQRLARREGRKRVLQANAFAGAAAPALSTGVGMTLTSPFLSLFSFAVGSLGLVLYFVDQMRRPEPGRECSTCEGTGLVACVCHRWSDGDKGCSICAGTGRMSCPSCGGGGTAVPIALRAEIIKVKLPPVSAAIL